MNNAPLNTFALNSDVLDASQRSVVVANVVAQVYISPRILRRAEILGGVITAEARVTPSPRAVIRCVSGFVPEAVLGFHPRSYATSPVAIQPSASITADGTGYSRTEVRAPSVWTAEAALSPSPRMRARPDFSITPEASVLAGYRTFASVRSPVVVDSSIQFWLSVGVLRRIPFYENAIDERTLLVPADDRTIFVS